jgi:hypothetical protein
MKFEYNIEEKTTEEEFLKAAKEKFEEYKKQKELENFGKKVEKIFKILNEVEQMKVECSKAFFDYVSKTPKFQAILDLKISESLPEDKIAFIIDSKLVEPITIIFK